MSDVPRKSRAKRDDWAAMRHGLPHLYERKWYTWAKTFFESTNQLSLLCAANQISKSSTQIRKCIEMAGNPLTWRKFWPEQYIPPRQFWYLYPSAPVVMAEVNLKWVPEFLPRGEYKEHPTYGWRLQMGDRRRPEAIIFNSGVHVFFKTYEQDVHNLQSGTCHAIFCFPAGTLVRTRWGAKRIEALEIGDLVLTQDGSYQPVVGRQVRVARTVTRSFSSGQTIRATADHPFWTENRGWVSFSGLTAVDQCGTLRGWKLTERLSYLKACFTAGVRSIRTLGRGITSAVAEAVDSCTSRFGRLSTDAPCPMGTSSTTKILTLWTIGWRTFSCLLAKSTPESTRKRSGGLGGRGTSHVVGVGWSSHREAHRSGPLASVHKSVGDLLKRLNASVASLFSRRAPTLRPCTVLETVQTSETVEPVFNITVAGSHTYFANGVLVHNCDEELPENLFSELKARLFGTDGPFSMVFTATRNQDFWRRALEGTGETELFPDALKMQVSMFDCMTYADGTPGAFTKERIERIIATCKSETEVQRRVYGKFVTEQGRKYGEFDATRHYVKPFEIPIEWPRFGGVDIGSGGGPGGAHGGHPPAVVLIAVQPDYRKGYVYRGWKGDDGQVYTNGDILQKFLELRGSDSLVMQKYDQAAKDFHTLAERSGETFEKSEKAHSRGEDVINTLFKNDMLVIFDEPELQKLGGELSTLMTATAKKHALDDLTDALRYGVVDIPWDWTALKGAKTQEERAVVKRKPFTEAERLAMEIAERRGEMVDVRGDEQPDGWEELESEFAEWNEAYGA